MRSLIKKNQVKAEPNFRNFSSDNLIQNIRTKIYYRRFKGVFSLSFCVDILKQKKSMYSNFESP